MIIASTLLMLLTPPVITAPSKPSVDIERDVFIGTLEMEQGQPVLNRCGLSGIRYRLHDAEGMDAVANFVKDARTAYGEVIASYAEEEGQHTLAVFAIDNLTPGKSCHLSDALEAMESATKDVSAPDKAFIGHYYLSGIRETGSELLLRPDGSFEWYMSYGAVDQMAQGSWAREGKTIVLTSAKPPADKPLFSFIEVEPWSTKAEDEMLRREHDAKAQEVRDTCPFLTDSWVSAPSMQMFDKVQPLPAELLQKAADSLREAQTARSLVEMLARDVMALPATERTASKDVITQVLQDWVRTRDEAREASLHAGLGAPILSEPALPAACIFPSPAAASNPAVLAGGLGVRVYDLASHQGARGVEVTLGFADGHTKQISTAERGLAIIRGPFATGVVKISLNADYAEGRGASFDIPATSNGIIHFSIDASQLTQPAFDSLELRIEGRALIPDQFGRGRYERQP